MTIKSIYMRRGSFAHLPTLHDGEPYYANDVNQLWIGSPSGNVLLYAGGASAGSSSGGTTSTGGGTSTPPTPTVATSITAHTPSAATINDFTGSFTVTFSAAMNKDSVELKDDWSLTSTSGSPSITTVAYDPATKTASFTIDFSSVTVDSTLSLLALPGVLDAQNLPVNPNAVPIVWSYHVIVVSGGGGGGGGGTIPTFTSSTIAGLAAWYKADAGVTGTTAVSAWADQSGNSRNLTQSLSGHQPALVANVVSTFPAIRFSATSTATYQSLDHGTAYSSALQKTTQIIVFKPSDATTEMVPFSSWDGDQNAIHTNYSGKYAANFGLLSGNIQSSTAAAAALHIVALTWDRTGTAQATLYVDGVQVAQSAVGADYSQVTNIRVGAGYQSTYATPFTPVSKWFNGDIYEVMVFDHVLTSGDMSTAHAYLSAKWLGVSTPTVAGTTTITSFSPAIGSGLAALPSTFTVNFNALMNKASVETTGNWSITSSTHGVIPISGIVLTNGTNSASAVISRGTDPGVVIGETITITAGTGVHDSTGASLGSPTTFTWLMSNNPSIVSQSPAAGTVGTFPTHVTVTFNQAMGSSAFTAGNWTATARVPGTTDAAGTVQVTAADPSADQKSVMLTLVPTKVYSGAAIKITGASLVGASGNALSGSNNFTYNYYNDTVGTLTALPHRCCAKTSSWNQLLPESPTLASYSTTQITNLVNIINHGVNAMPTGVSSVSIDCSLGNIGPIYFTAPGDPTVQIRQSGGYGDLAGTQPMPTAVQAAGGTDAHLTVLNATTGDEYDYYQFNSANVTIAQGASITCTAGGKANYYTGSGWEEGIGPNGTPGPLNQSLGGYVTSAGNTLMAGVVTIDELMSGQINHALSMATWGNPLTDGVWPASAAANYPGNAYSTAQGYGNMPGSGSLIWSDLTDAQVDALSFDVFSTMILKAMHHYGAFVTDTQGYVAFNFRQIGVVPRLNTSAQTTCNSWIDANTVAHTHDIRNYMFSLQAQPKSWFITHWHLIDPTWLQTQRGSVR